LKGYQAEQPRHDEWVLAGKRGGGREGLQGKEEDACVGCGILVAELLLEVGGEEAVEGIEEGALCLLKMVEKRFEASVLVGITSTLTEGETLQVFNDEL
jgi:hypothetical protein